MPAPEDVVITCLLTAVPDPQRKEYLPSDVAVIDELRRSVHRHGRRLIVLHDCLDEPDDELTTFVRVPKGGNPYWHRWRVIEAYLQRHADELRFVWCVDGTDVEMLNDPFPHMEFGDIYVGSEDAQLGTPPDGGTPTWLRGHCPSFTAWFAANPDEHVLNVGTVGSSCHWVMLLASLLEGREFDGDDYEMGAFNWLMRTTFASRLVTGHPVHSKFLANDRRSSAWWRHK